MWGDEPPPVNMKNGRLKPTKKKRLHGEEGLKIEKGGKGKKSQSGREGVHGERGEETRI